MATLITNTDIGTSLYVSFTDKLEAREQLKGNNYLVVYGNNTPLNNGAELISKLSFAKAVNPNSQVKSDTNRMTVIITPGIYLLPSPTTFLEMDTPYVDLVSLTGDADVFLNTLSGTTAIKVTSSDVKIKGFNLIGQHIIVEGSFANNYFENIIGGDYNFSNGTTSGQVSGNFKNCVGGNTSFADVNNSEELISSTLENCTALDYSFGYNIITSTLINCLGAFRSFGYNLIDISDLTDCTAQGDSFGCEVGISNSTLTNCTADGFSFGRTNVSGQSTDIANCILNNCKAGINSFAVVNRNSNTFINCIAGDESFGADVANSIYKNCKGGDNSFGSGLQGWGDLIAGGSFYSCEAGNSSFGTQESTGTFYYCKAGNNSFLGVNNGTTFTGNAYYTTGMNPTVNGILAYCLDWTNNPINVLASTTNNI